MWRDFIEQKPGVLDLIIEKLVAGETIDDLLKAYPTITKESLLACLSYGAASVRNETVIEIL